MRMALNLYEGRPTWRIWCIWSDEGYLCRLKVTLRAGCCSVRWKRASVRLLWFDDVFTLALVCVPPRIPNCSSKHFSLFLTKLVTKILWCSLRVLPWILQPGDDLLLSWRPITMRSAHSNSILNTSLKIMIAALPTLCWNYGNEADHSGEILLVGRQTSAVLNVFTTSFPSNDWLQRMML